MVAHERTPFLPQLHLNRFATMALCFDSACIPAKKQPRGRGIPRMRLLGGVSVLALATFAVSGRVRAANTGLCICSNTTSYTNSGTITGSSVGIGAYYNITTLTNNGTVTGTNFTGLFGGATISTLNNNGTFHGALNGISQEGVIGTLTNSGSIQGGGEGLLNNFYSSITSWMNSGHLVGATSGLNNIGHVGTLTNSGTISNTGGHKEYGYSAGVYSDHYLGTLTNSGLIQGTEYGVDNAKGTSRETKSTNTGNIGVVTNSGTIIGGKVGFFNDAGTIGAVTNAAGGTITAGQGSAGVYNTGTIASLINSGTIAGEVQGLYNGSTLGSLTNTSGATITGGNGAYGLHNAGEIGPLTNAGLIVGAHTGFYNTGTTGALTNSGTITGSTLGIFNAGVIDGLSNTGVIKSLNNEEMITGGNSGLFNSGSIATLTNSGRITGDAFGIAAESGSIGTLTNNGTISSSGDGVYNNGGSIGFLSNTGVISGGQTGVFNTGTIGSFSNTGTISGGNYALYSVGDVGAVINSGVIDGNISSQAGQYAPSEYYFSIAGASSNALGTLTGGTITVGNGNLTFSAGNILLADNITVDGGLGTVTSYATITVNTPQTITGYYDQTPSGVLIIGTGTGGELVVTQSAPTSPTSPTDPTSPTAPTAPTDPPVFIQANHGDLSPTGSYVLIDTTGAVDYSGYKATGIGYEVGLSTVVTGNDHYELVANLRPTNFNFDSGYNLVLTGLDGSRSLAQTGPGITTLIGDIGYTGATTVTGGTLNILGAAASPSYSVTGGTLRADGILSGVVTVSDGGTLAGSGAFGGGTIGSGGIVAPANLISSVPTTMLAQSQAAGRVGSLTSNGNLTFAEGSIYQLEADAAGQSDKIVVNGTALLSGGTVRVLAGQGSYAQKTQYTILAATDGVSGAFSGVLSNLAFLTPTLSYDPGDVYLTLRRNDVDYTSLAKTANQYAVAAALQASYFKPLAAAGGAILDSVNSLGTAAVPAAFDGVSGAGITGAQTATYGAVDLFTAAARGQQAYWLMGETEGTTAVAGSAMAPGAGKRSWRSWAAPLARSATLNGDASVGSTSVTAQAAGGAAGLDFKVNRNLLVGIMAGGATDSYSVSNLSTSGTMTGGDVGLYGVSRWGGFYASGLLSFAAFSGQSTRVVSGLGMVENEKGDLSQNAYTGRIELGYRAQTPIVNVTPFVAFQATSLEQSGFTETSTVSSGQPGALGLAVQSAGGLSEPGSLGLQFDQALVTQGGWTILPVLRLAWVHNFQTSRSVTAELAGLPGNPWTVNGASAAANAADIGFSLQGTNRRGLSLFAAVEAQPSGQGSAYQGQLGLKLMW